MAKLVLPQALGKAADDVARAAFGILGAEDEHVLGEPAFLASDSGGDTERQALLAEQRVAAVAAADRPDRVVLGEVADEAALGIQVERGVQAAIEVVAVAEVVERHLPHARHDAHVEGDVDAVGELDADLGEGRAVGTHEVGHHVHRPAAHRAVEELAELRVRLLGVHPVVVGPGRLLGAAADEREVLGARDVVRIGAVQVAARPLLLVERDQDALRHRFFGERLLFLLRAVAPVDPLGLGEPSHLVDPGTQVGVGGGRRRCERPSWVRLIRHRFAAARSRRKCPMV